MAISLEYKLKTDKTVKFINGLKEILGEEGVSEDAIDRVTKLIHSCFGIEEVESVNWRDVKKLFHNPLHNQFKDGGIAINSGSELFIKDSDDIKLADRVARVKGGVEVVFDIHTKGR